MNKIFSLMAAVVLIALCAGACSPQGSPDARQTAGALNTADGNSQDTAIGQNAAGEQYAAEGQDKPASMQMYFGKVKGLVGNELTLSLAELPGAQDTEGGQNNVEAAGEGTGEVVMAATVAAAASTGDAMPEGRERMELDWLDEDRSFTLPAGLTIIDMTTGQTVNMDALKKSAVVMLMVNEDTGSVMEAQIWEQP